MDTLFDILIEDDAQTSVAVFAMSEPDIELAAVQPWVSFCNDSPGTSPEGPLGKEFPHPRAYGTFPRVLRKYVREERRMRLEEAIRKFTSLPGLAAASQRPRRHQGRHVGGYRGVRSGDHHRPGDLLGPQSAVGRHAVGARERRSGHRRRGRHRCAPGPGAARRRVSPLNAPRDPDRPDPDCAPRHPCAEGARTIIAPFARAISNEEPWNRPIPGNLIIFIK